MMMYLDLKVGVMPTTTMHPGHVDAQWMACKAVSVNARWSRYELSCHEELAINSILQKRQFYMSHTMQLSQPLYHAGGSSASLDVIEFIYNGCCITEPVY
jgi:hypothetical protein